MRLSSVKRYSPRYALRVLIAVSAVFSLLRFDIMQVGGSVDDAQYVVLAESLASGQGYRLINYPEPSSEVAFPPGWPLLLTPLVALFPDNFTVLKLLSLFFWLLTIPLVFRLFSIRLNAPFLELLTALVATNALLVAASTMLMAEAAFLFFSIATLYLFHHCYRRSAQRYWLVPIVALAAVYTQLIRSVGLALVLALPLFLALRRRFRLSATLTGCIAIAIIPQFLLFSGRGGGFFSQHYQTLLLERFSLSDAFLVTYRQAIGYADIHIADALIPVFRPAFLSFLESSGAGFLIPLLNWLILLSLGVGFFLSLRRMSPWDLYVILYSGAILTFRDPVMGDVQPRFLIPLIPFFYFYLIYGLRWFIRHAPYLKTVRPQYIVGCAVFLMALISVKANIHSWINPTRDRTTDLSAGAAWIRKHASPDAVVMTRDPVPRYLYARRTTIGYPRRDQDVGGYLRDNQVDYVLVAPILQTPTDNRLDGYSASHLLPYLRQRSTGAQLVFVDPEHNVRVFKMAQHE